MASSSEFNSIWPMVTALHREKPDFCCLHIVFDDGNTTDRDVVFALDRSIHEGHYECMMLACRVLQVDRGVRQKLYRAVSLGHDLR